MAQTTFLELLARLFVLLALGGAAPPTQPPQRPALSACMTQEVPVFAELDVAALRRFVASAPELKALAAQGKDPAQAVEEAVGAFASLTGADAAAIRDLVATVQRAGFWLIAFGQDEYQLRFLLVVEHASSGGEVLPTLLKRWTPPAAGPGAGQGNGGEPAYSTVSYLGTLIHVFAGNQGVGVWLCETAGAAGKPSRIAIAMDPLAIKAFLLRTRELDRAAPAPASASQSGGASAPILMIEGQGGAFRDCMLVAMGRHDRDDFLPFAAAVDLPAWRSLSATFDGRRLEARLRVEPESQLARTLEGPEQPTALLAAVPDDAGLALIASLRRPLEVWQLFRAAIDEASAFNPRARERANKTLEDIHRQLGIDLEQDLLDNLAAAAFVVPQLTDDRDLERRSVFLFEARDAERAAASLNVFAMAVFGADAPMTEAWGARVWENDNIRIALKDKVVVIAPGRESPFDSILRDWADGTSELADILAARCPGATSFAVFNPSGLIPHCHMTPLMAGLSFADGALSFQTEIDPIEISKTVANVLEEERRTAARAGCRQNLQRVMLAAMQMARAGDAFPAQVEDLRPRLQGGRSDALICPLSGKPYVLNRSLSGQKLGELKNQSESIVACDAPGAHADGGHVAYANGQVRWLDKTEFDNAVAGIR